jgi:DNA invertase Pin-like site-specific DNA recombinase
LFVNPLGGDFVRWFQAVPPFTGLEVRGQQVPPAAPLPMQLSAMRDYVKRRGWKVILNVEDVGSGASVRTRREELLKAARRRQVDAIVIWRLDRWGRSLVDLVTNLQELASLQVGFVSLSEALDLTTPSGRALAGMLAVFAEFERDTREASLSAVP